MRKMKVSYLFFILLLLGSACNEKKGECHKKITINNNSDKAIYVIGDTYFPDTMFFGLSPNPASEEYYNKVYAKSSNDRSLQNRDCWETYFSYGELIPSDTLMIFIFDAEVLETEEWSDVIHDYNVLKLYKYGREDNT